MSDNTKNIIYKRIPLIWLSFLFFLLFEPIFDHNLTFAKTMSLGEVLHQVEQNAPILKAAQANAKMFKAKRSVVRSKFLGEIDAFAHDLHYNDDRLTRPMSPPINMSALTYDDNQIGYGLSAQLPLDINGHIRYNFHALSHQANAAQEDAYNVRLNLLHSAAKIYRGLEQVTGQREALQKQAEALTGHINVATTAIKIGRIAPVEKLRLVAELKNVEGHLAELDGVEATLRAQLASLMNVSSFTDSIPTMVEKPQLLQTSPDKLKNRPDLKAAKERKDATHAGVIAAKVTYLPEFFATANWQQNQGYNGSGQDDATWQVMIKARLPLWNGGRRRAEIGQAKAQNQAARYKLLALQEKARAEFVASQSKWNAGQAQYEAAKSALAASEEMTRIQTDRFNEGRLSAADLVDAEATLERARSGLTTSLVKWWQADDAMRQTIGLPPAAYLNNQTKK